MSVGVCPGRRSDRSWCEPLKDLIVKGEPQTLCFAQASGSHLRVCAENLLSMAPPMAPPHREVLHGERNEARP